MNDVLSAVLMLPQVRVKRCSSVGKRCRGEVTREREREVVVATRNISVTSRRRQRRACAGIFVARQGDDNNGTAAGEYYLCNRASHRSVTSSFKRV